MELKNLCTCLLMATACVLMLECVMYSTVNLTEMTSTPLNYKYRETTSMESGTAVEDDGSQTTQGLQALQERRKGMVQPLNFDHQYYDTNTLNEVLTDKEAETTTGSHSTPTKKTVEVIESLSSKSVPKPASIKPNEKGNNETNAQYRDMSPVVKAAGWTIYRNDTKLRETITKIHNSYYKIRPGHSCKSRYPGVIIVGVSKCGTRELSDFMAMHPNIIVKSSNSYYKVSEHVIRSGSREKVANQMPCSYPDQVTSFKQDFFFEISDMPKLLKRLNPRQKIIATVREPISRILSHLSFRHMKNGKMDNMISFSNHMFNSKNGVLSVNAKANAVRISRYAECYKRYLKYFSAKNILIIDVDEVNKNLTSVLSKIQNFLQLKQTINYNKHLVKNPESGFFCVRIPEVENEMACFDNKRGRSDMVTNITETEMNTMRDYFRLLNEQFFKLIGHKFENWSYQE